MRCSRHFPFTVMNCTASTENMQWETDIQECPKSCETTTREELLWYQRDLSISRFHTHRSKVMSNQSPQLCCLRKFHLTTVTIGGQTGVPERSIAAKTIKTNTVKLKTCFLTIRRILTRSGGRTNFCAVIWTNTMSQLKTTYIMIRPEHRTSRTGASHDTSNIKVCQRRYQMRRRTIGTRPAWNRMIGTERQLLQLQVPKIPMVEGYPRIAVSILSWDQKFVTQIFIPWEKSNVKNHHCERQKKRAEWMRHHNVDPFPMVGSRSLPYMTPQWFSLVFAKQTCLQFVRASTDMLLRYCRRKTPWVPQDSKVCIANEMFDLVMSLQILIGDASLNGTRLRSGERDHNDTQAKIYKRPKIEKLFSRKYHVVEL